MAEQLIYHKWQSIMVQNEFKTRELMYWFSDQKLAGMYLYLMQDLQRDG